MISKSAELMSLLENIKLTFALRSGRLAIGHVAFNQMSITFPNPTVKFSPFHTILQDGIGRLRELIANEEFTFIMKGEEFKITFFEAVLISPIISERLKTDPENHEFHIESDETEMKQFSTFVDFIRNREEFNLSREEKIVILSICKLLGNDKLSLLILGSFHCGVSMKSFSSNEGQCESESSEMQNLCEMSVEDCASKFNSYSTAELRNISKEMLHSLLSSPSLRLENEDSLLQQLISLGSEYFEYWIYLEIVFLSSEGISKFVETFPFDELRTSHWSKIVDRLVGVCDKTFRSRRFCKLEGLKESKLHSTILSTIPPPLNQFSNHQWRLLYRGSRDGFRASNFHSKCDGESRTVTVILTTKDFIFGGFTPIAWDSSNSNRVDNSQQSFLFSVKDSRNSDPRSFPLVKSSYAIYCYSAYGPIFGGNHDLLVSDCCNENTNSYTNVGYSYRNDTRLNGNQVFTGEYNFQVKEIEIFSVTL
jgi:hypothetical protein